MLTASGELLGTHIEAIYHTAIVVFGMEYWFGQGLQCAPRDATQTQFGQPMWTETLGTTELTRDIFEDWLRDASSRYSADTYSLLEHNCNNFSDEAGTFLCGVGVPKKILDLPETVLSTEIGQALKPFLGMFENRMRSTQGTAIGGKAGDKIECKAPATTAQEGGARASVKINGLGGGSGLEPSKKPRVSKSASSSSSSSSTAPKREVSGEDLMNMVRSMSQHFGDLRNQGASTQQAVSESMFKAKDALADRLSNENGGLRKSDSAKEL